MVSAPRLMEAGKFLRTGVLTGPTASGKTGVSIELTRALSASGVALEIVNADSLVFYRHLDIGTAKPTMEERRAAPHHLIDIRDPGEPFTAGDFVREATRAVDEIEARGARALIVGGTAFYLKALLFGLWKAPPSEPRLREELNATDPQSLYAEVLARDADAAYRIGPNDRYRLVRAVEILRLTGRTPTELESERPREPLPRFRLAVIDREPADLDARLAERARMMLRQGWVEETRSVRARFPGARELGAVGYAQICAWLDGIAPEGREPASGEAGLENEVLLATRQLVKKQRTFFRSLVRDARGERFELDHDRAALDPWARSIYL